MAQVRRRGQAQGWLFLAPALMFVALFVLAPLWQLAAMSLTDRSLLGGGRFVGFANYARIWNDSGFWRALLFTVKYTVFLTPILMGLGFALALLTVDNTPLKRATRTIVFLPVVIGLVEFESLVVLAARRAGGLFNKLLVDLHVLTRADRLVHHRRPRLLGGGDLDHLEGRRLRHGAVRLGHPVDQLRHSRGRRRWTARAIGAGSADHLPLTRRIMLLTTLVSAIGSMLAFDQFYIMTSGAPRGQTFTAVYWIYQNSFVSFRLGYGSALSVVLTLIILRLRRRCRSR